MCTFAGARLLLLCEITVLRLLPVFQSAHLLLIGFKFCVFMYVQGVCGVYLPLCVGVCLWACGGQRRIWVSCSVHSLLSPLRQGLKGFVIVFFSVMVWACRHFCLLVLLEGNSLIGARGDGSVARC